MNFLRFAALLFAALALAPAMAHLLELPNKIGLSPEDYLTVQQIYRGWALLGVVVFGALLSTLALAIAVRNRDARALGGAANAMGVFARGERRAQPVRAGRRGAGGAR